MLASLYQGFSTNLFLKVPYMAAMFGFNSLNQKLLSHFAPEDEACGKRVDGHHMLSASSRDLFSALLTGVEASLLLSPLELIRIQGQNKGKGGLMQASRYTYNKIGLKGILSTGMVSCMNREAKYCVGQFFAIGVLNDHLEEWSSRNQSNNMFANSLSKNSDLRAVLSSISVGFICTILSHPDDVVRHCFQISSSF